MARPQGLVTLYLASIVARLPLGAVSLLLLLRTRELTGSYALGGLVSAANGLATAVCAPLLGRLVDRRGQAPVLVPAATVAAAALAGFALLGEGAPVAAAAGLAFLAGAGMPPVSSCLRAVLGQVYAPERRHRAFAFDSTLFELIYIAGPLLVVGVIGAWSLRAAVATAAGAVLLGTIAFSATRLSREWRGETAPRGFAGALRGGGVRTLMAVVCFFAIGMATVEVAIAAFANREGGEGTIGVLLGLWGAGSLCGGLLATRSGAPADPVRRLLLMLLALAAANLPLAFADSVEVMAVAITVAGVGIAPSLAIIFQIVGDVAPAGTVTEAMSWMSSMIALGLAGGAALAGAIVEHSGTTAALLLVAAYGAIAAAVVAARSGTLSA